jgi:hypothetical protein
VILELRDRQALGDHGDIVFDGPNRTLSVMNVPLEASKCCTPRSMSLTLGVEQLTDGETRGDVEVRVGMSAIACMPELESVGSVWPRDDESPVAAFRRCPTRLCSGSGRGTAAVAVTAPVAVTAAAMPARGVVVDALSTWSMAIRPIHTIAGSASDDRMNVTVAGSGATAVSIDMRILAVRRVYQSLPIRYAHSACGS